MIADYIKKNKRQNTADNLKIKQSTTSKGINFATATTEFSPRTKQLPTI